ncbi:MAG: hypothetical protein PWR20_514 [Bacteroidales bacterium]|nr:hypothetical protein [Bacteroidales bacterium]MDN5328942.1 hypothetical protein [Bacteroidales bacterium]
MVNRFIFKFHPGVAVKISLVLISIGLFLLLNSCGKNEEFRFDTSYNKATSLDFLMAEHNYRSIFLLLYKLSMDTATLNKGSGFIDSAYVTGKGNNWVFTFDENKKVPDGSTRSGQIVVEWTAPLVDSGAVANVSFKNYTVNQKDITGSLIIRQLAYRALKYKVEIDSGVITKNSPEISVVRYEGSFFLRRYAGASTTYNWGDDIFKIYSQAQGRGSESDRFSFSSVDSLQWRLSCRFLSGGLGLLEMPDFEINQIEMEYPQLNECSGVLKVTYKIKPANGAIRKVLSQNLAIYF